MFVDDIPAQNAYFAFIIRSPKAKGTLKSINSPPLGFGYRLLKAQDIPGKNLLYGSDMPILAHEKISYIGEPVGLLVGPDKIKLAEYAHACTVEIEEEEACLSLAQSTVFFSEHEEEYGCPPKASGDIVVEGTYETGIQEHWYSEPHGAIAEISAKGQSEALYIKTASQSLEHVKNTVMDFLDLKAGQVFIANADLGIHLDGKTWYPSVIAALASLAAFITKKQVKLQLTREEDYLFSPKRTPSIIHIKSLLSSEGQMIETEVTMKIGFGAYAVQSEKILENAQDAFYGIYKTGKLNIKRTAVGYNVPPTGPFAGFGSSCASFALERHITKICDTFKEEGSLWRIARLQAKLRSRFQSDEKDNSAGNTQNNTGNMPSNDILRAVTEKSGYKRKWAAYELLRHTGSKETERILPQRGIGLALALAENNEEESQNHEKARHNPIAAAVIEVEIDRINYDATIRGIWIYITSSPLNDKVRAKYILRRSLIAALGWTSTEKIKFEDGKIVPAFCALYQLVSTHETPPIFVEFIEEDDKEEQDDHALESLPFSVIPAAYTQAISQAVNHHFERIPIIGQDLWRVINLMRLEEERKRAEEENKGKEEAADGEGV
ncbi:MAG: xanthine dehydrogenase family protein molybdopterin-binding subunit [Spirochaetaceae bacterium]|jgi:CO/xanthine dehydrogenase Mo-binding subunit|nr:xanthine dehydrogenase family protein molybdopterin-binding subunit [Spirochaetaceae bacterium]